MDIGYAFSRDAVCSGQDPVGGDECASTRGVEGLQRDLTAEETGLVLCCSSDMIRQLYLTSIHLLGIQRICFNTSDSAVCITN